VQVIARDRQLGKTTDLIRLAAQDWLYVVCPDRRQVQHVVRTARAMSLDIPFPLTWHEFTSGAHSGKGINGFVIDNLDHCVQGMTPVPIRAVSLTVQAERRLPPAGRS
jgi:hypothetical protein